MSDVRNLVERLRQIAESQWMDFDSPNVVATLDDAATTLEALAAIGSIVAEEPEWEPSAQDLLDAIYNPDEDSENHSVRYGYILEQLERLRGKR